MLPCSPLSRLTPYKELDYKAPMKLPCSIVTPHKGEFNYFSKEWELNVPITIVDNNVGPYPSSMLSPP